MDDQNLNRNIYLNPKNSGIQQIVGRVPPWLVLWGITICSCAILIGLLICWQVKYSDVITVPVEVQSINGPYILRNKMYGQLSQVLVNNDSKVLKDQVVLYFDKDGDIGQILNVIKVLNETRILDPVLLHQLSTIKETDKLGTLQPEFDRLKDNVKRHLSNPSQILLKTLTNEISDFKHQVAVWEDTHLRRSTSSGRIEYPRSPTLNKMYASNEVLFYVVPDNISFKAILCIPKKFENSISAESTVSVKLNDFPANQFGTISGKVNKLLTSTLNDSVFFASMDIEKSIYTSRGIKIILNNTQQKGVAEIVLNRTRLLYKIIHFTTQ